MRQAGLASPIDACNDAWISLYRIWMEYTSNMDGWMDARGEREATAFPPHKYAHPLHTHIHTYIHTHTHTHTHSHITIHFNNKHYYSLYTLQLLILHLVIVPDMYETYKTPSSSSTIIPMASPLPLGRVSKVVSV